jgi:hypothetical protein
MPIGDLFSTSGPSDRYNVMRWWIDNKKPARLPGESSQAYKDRVKDAWKRFTRTHDLSSRTGMAKVRSSGQTDPHSNVDKDIERWLKNRRAHIFARAKNKPKPPVKLRRRRGLKGSIFLGMPT